MAKKTTRERKQLARDRAIQQAAANVAMTAVRVDAAAEPAALETPATPVRGVRAADFTEEYNRVRSDLRRIAVLAVSIVAVLIVLSFII